MTSLIIVSSTPYGTDRPYTALRLALALLEKGSVRIFLLVDGVFVALRDQSSASEDQNLATRLAVLLEKGVEVKACGLCLETRGAHTAPLVSGVRVGSMPELAEWITTSDRVVNL